MAQEIAKYRTQARNEGDATVVVEIIPSLIQCFEDDALSVNLQKGVNQLCQQVMAMSDNRTWMLCINCTTYNLMQNLVSIQMLH